MKRSSAELLGLYSVLVVAWGLNYVFVRAGLQVSSPLWLATERAGFGLIGCAMILLILRHRPQLRGRDVRDAILIGLPNTTLFFGLWFVAAVTVPPGQTAVIIYTFPLWVAVLSGPLLHRRLIALQWAAIIGGFAGVVLVAEPWAVGPGAISAASAVQLLAAAVVWALATVWYKRRFSGNQDALEANTYQLLGGTLGLLGASLLLEPAGPAPFTPSLLGIVLWLGLVGTALAYFIWFFLLNRYPAATLTAYTFMVPVVALAAGVALSGETLSLVQVAGVAVIALSIYGVARESRFDEHDPRSAASLERSNPVGPPKDQ